MKKIIFKGCGTAIATPFTQDGINFKEFGKLIDFQIQEGIDSIIVCGTTGESSTMSEQEKKDTIAFAIKQVAGKVPVIAGTGGNNTRVCCSNVKICRRSRCRWLISCYSLL